MSSGSADSEVAVNPIRSQNSAVMTLRSSATGRAGAPRGVAHSLQNFAPSGFSVPQEAQVLIAGDYAGAQWSRNESRARPDHAEIGQTEEVQSGCFRAYVESYMNRAPPASHPTILWKGRSRDDVHEELRWAPNSSGNT